MMTVSLCFVNLSFLFLCLFRFLLFCVSLVLVAASANVAFGMFLEVSGLRKQENCLSAVNVLIDRNV